MYAIQVDMRDRVGIPAPPTGRPRRPSERPSRVGQGRVLGDFPDLIAEWDWDLNGDLDPAVLAAGGRQAKVAWRCLLTRPTSGRPASPAGPTSIVLPVPHGQPRAPVRIAGGLLPWLRPRMASDAERAADRTVTRASGREVHWRCEVGHEWPAVVYSRTLSGSGCPECFRISSAAKAKAGVRRRRKANDDRVEKQVALVVWDTDAPAPQ